MPCAARAAAVAPTGRLHEVKPVTLLADLMKELQHRNEPDTAQIDDALIGCVQPHGEQGSVIAKIAALNAGWDWRVPGLQLNRYCGSGLEVANIAAQKIHSGREDLIVPGGVESMSRIGMGAASSAREAHGKRTGSESAPEFPDAANSPGGQGRPDGYARRTHARAGRCICAAVASPTQLTQPGCALGRRRYGPLNSY